MSVNSKMTAIADKIRTLLGLTGTMGLDEMASHLGTEQSNVTAALAAIAGKGVTVPDGSNSDSLASLIAAIEAGGSIYTGSFTYESDKTFPSISIEKFGGKIPEWLMVVNTSETSATDKLRLGFHHQKSYASSGTNYCIQDSWLVYQTTYIIRKDRSNSTNQNTTVSISSGIPSLKCYAGDVYEFVAFGEMPQ